MRELDSNIGWWRQLDMNFGPAGQGLWIDSRLVLSKPALEVTECHAQHGDHDADPMCSLSGEVRVFKNPARARDAKMLADLQAKTRELESTFHAQYERVQTQLSHTLAQLAAKGREHGELLRTLVAKASRPVRRPRIPPSD